MLNRAAFLVRSFTFITLVVLGFSSLAVAQPIDTSLYQSMKWRMIGPFRGGRTVGAVGIPAQPNVFYIGVNNGGVWKTTDAGRTWQPIFDEQPTGSIGDIAIAPSNPNVIYVGSGEGLQRPDLATGDGMYRSSDGGKTWTHLGLREGQQIASIAVDPKDENRLFVAVLGHPYGPNEERGIYRSTNGGRTFDRVLYKDENTGAMLEWKDIDFRAGLIRILGTNTKTERERLVPLTERVKTELYDIKKITEGDRPFPFTDFKRSWATAKRLAGIEDLHFHDLRRTAITRWILQGNPIALAGKIAGHTRLETTMKHYTSVDAEIVHAFTEKMDSIHAQRVQESEAEMVN